MPHLKQLLLWVMIVYCTTCQISCTKIMIVGDHLTNASCRAYPVINSTCHSSHDKLVGNFCIVNVGENSSREYCETLDGRKYKFDMKKLNSTYEVIMEELVTGILLWFIPDDLRCLPSDVLNPTAQYSTLGTRTINTTQDVLRLCAGCLANHAVNPGQSCGNSSYNESVCKGREGNKYVLIANGTTWECSNCSKPPVMTSTTPTNPSTPTDPSTPAYEVMPVDGTFNLTSDNQELLNGKTDPDQASKTLDNLENLSYLMEKENKSNVAIVIGEVKGLLVRHDKKKETQDVNICLSDNNMLNVVLSNKEVNFPWSVKISKEAFDKSSLENNGSTFVGVLRFKNMGNNSANHRLLNNDVFGITMGANISNLTDNIEIFIKQENLNGDASCNSWDGRGNLEWTSFGCKTTRINDTIKCSCSHLTFFAILMSMPNANATEQYVDSLTYITNIGCGFSMFFLGMGLFMHFLLRKAKSNQATKILINMFVALFLLNLSFLCNESIANTQDNSACTAIALIMHYSMLSTFTWFFIQALHMYLWLIRQNVTTKNYMRKICAVGWACPASIVLIIVSIGEYKRVVIRSATKTTQMCWITNPYVHNIVNIGYYALVFIFTTGIFIMMVTKIIQARNIMVGDVKKTTFRKQLTMILSLLILFGLTWGIAFFSYGPMVIPSYYIFSVLNSFQGFFVFLYYYHIHNDVDGSFSDDPDSSTSMSNKTIQSSINTQNNAHD